MTITTPSDHEPPRTRTPALRWTLVQSGLWVAKNGDDFAGMVEADDQGRFSASSRFAAPLGTFGTLAQAKAAVAA